MLDKYLNRLALYPARISEAPSPELELIVVIPCYDEHHLLDTLNALANCDHAQTTTEVIVVVNHGESANEKVKGQNAKTVSEMQHWKETDPNRSNFHCIEAFDLRDKKAGVGLARKIGMDEAVRRFSSIGREEGVMLCFDADCLCSNNYLSETLKYFQDHPKVQAASLHYEHPIIGDTPETLGITLYEMHLRYYIEMQRFLMLPYAYHTVGSSMAVRALAYARIGGMNQRKAGEDFYFVQKCIKSFPFGEINNVRIIPSARCSHRVPFGTGKAIGDMLSQDSVAYRSYHPQSFYDLDNFFTQLSDIYYHDSHTELDPVVQAFLDSKEYRTHISEIKFNTSSFESFYKRFFRWFDAFMLMKYLHYRRDIDLPDIPVEEAMALHFWETNNFTTIEKLDYLRQRQLESNY